MISPVTNRQERAFEKQQILAKKDKYLASNVADKLVADEGWRNKVEYIENGVKGIEGWILDVGANTCGESEYLVTKGYSMIAGDINECALGLSSERCAIFGRRAPRYCAFDAEHIPFAENSVSGAVVYEALHHVENPRRVLSEVHRVLKPLGRIFLYEPYAYDPYRRLSEVRDWFHGTIEKSFGVRELLELLKQTGFEVQSLERHVQDASTWKMEKLETFSAYRKWLRLVYTRVSKALPKVFGNVSIIARKKASQGYIDCEYAFEDLLRCPISGARLLKCQQSYVSMDPANRYAYPTHQGIPVLIQEEARLIEKREWETLLNSLGRIPGVDVNAQSLNDASNVGLPFVLR